MSIQNALAGSHGGRAVDISQDLTITHAVAQASDLTEVTNDSSIAPGAGSLVFTGHAPSADITVTPAAGSVVFTGFAPSITNDTVVAPPAGSLVFTGFAPSPDITVEPPAGAVVFTGHAPTPVARSLGGGLFTVIT